MGKGGEGSVWLAMHLQTEHCWALKEIPRTASGREYHEAMVMKRLHHPSLARVFEVLETPEHVVLVMAFVHGRNLEQICQEVKRLKTDQVLDTGIQVCGALRYLHTRKERVLHLDIKPANLILQDNGRVVLVDFGAARKETASEKERYATDGFAAPELFDLHCVPDERADIYALGATLFALISGVRYQAFMEKSHVPGCPEALERVLRRCLAGNRQERYRSADEVYRALVKVQRQQKRERIRIRLWALCLLMMLAGSLLSGTLRDTFRQKLKTEWSYLGLLEEAACSAGKERMELCRQAVYTEPARTEGYLFALQEVEKDGVLTLPEERMIRELLHTIPAGSALTYEELLSADPAAYGRITFELGKIYWYEYDGTGHSGRQIAEGWFKKAQKAAGELKETEKSGAESWLLPLPVYLRMAQYDEKLSNDGEDRPAAAAWCWEDIRSLKEENLDRFMSARQEMAFYLDVMDRLVMIAPVLLQESVSGGQIADLSDEILKKAAALSGKEPGSGWMKEKEKLIKERSRQLQRMTEGEETTE